MKRTNTFVIDAGFFKRDVLADQIDDVEPLFYFFNFVQFAPRSAF